MSAPVTDVDPYVSALVDSEAAAQDVVSDNLVALIAAMWASFAAASSALYAGELVADFGARVASYVVAAQRAAAQITEVHLRQQMLRMDFELPSTSIVDLPADLRLGAATEDVYQRPIRQVRYLESTGVPLAEAVQTATERLEKAALTDLQLARSTASQQVMYAAPETRGQKIRGYRRVIHPELGAVCGLCIAASDRIYRKKELLPLHPGCVIEGTEVSADGIRALTRRRYSGRLVVLRTSTGEKLTVTPNHPVLTDQGWVRADRLQVGDRVVRSGSGQRTGRRRPYQQQSPTRVEDVWRSLTVTSGLLPRSVPLASEDFHGDVAGEREVDVVLVDRHLAPVGDVSFAQPASEHGLVDAHGRRIGLSRSGVLALVLDRLLLPSGSLVGGSRDTLTFSGSGPVSQESRLGLRADRNFSAPESADDRGTGYAEVGRELLDRLAGQVEFSDLVEVDITTGSCHVYNLETGEGWYGASSIVVSNCKCTTIPVIGVQDPGGDLNAEDLAQLYLDAGGTSTEALRATRYEIGENGELGAVLTPAGAKLTSAERAIEQLSDRAKKMRREQLARQIEEMRGPASRSQWHRDRLEQLQELLRAA